MLVEFALCIVACVGAELYKPVAAIFLYACLFAVIVTSRAARCGILTLSLLSTFYYVWIGFQELLWHPVLAVTLGLSLAALFMALRLSSRICVALQEQASSYQKRRPVWGGSFFPLGWRPQRLGFRALFFRLVCDSDKARPV